MPVDVRLFILRRIAFAALPLDVRKSFAFPESLLHFFCGFAAVST